MSLNEVIVDYLRDDKLVSRTSNNRNDLSLIRGGKELLIRVSPPSRITRIEPSLINYNA